jgi:hypothetical protein
MGLNSARRSSSKGRVAVLTASRRCSGDGWPVGLLIECVGVHVRAVRPCDGARIRIQKD